MQYIIEKSEYDDAIGWARKDGFKMAIYAAADFSPGVADKLKALLVDPIDRDEVDRVVAKKSKA